MAVAKEQIRQIISENNINSVADIYTLLKDSFKDILQELKNRGVKDVLFFCVDGLPGFKEAIQAVYPQAEIQRCVIHMLRNSFKYVNYNDLKKFSSDFKEVYNAPNETAALTELENMKEKWGRNIRTRSVTGKIIGKM